MKRKKHLIIAEIVFTCFVIIWGITVSAAETSGWTAWLSSATLKIFPDDTAPASQETPFRMIAALNEYSPFQVAVNATENVKGVRITVSDLEGEGGTIPASGATLLIVETVTIERPSIAAKQKIWPDPLPPYHDFDVESGKTRSVWVDLFVPQTAKPGIYRGSVTITTEKNGSVLIPLILDVRDVSIPVKPTIRTAFGIGYGSIRGAHKTVKDSPEEKALFDAYYWFLVKHRLSPYYIPVDFFSEEAHKYLDDERVNFLRAPFSWDKEEMKKIAERLKSTGWIEKAVYYERDEPSNEVFPEVNRIGMHLHSIDPNLKYLITTGYTPALKEAKIDIWCPALTYTLDPNVMRGLKREQAHGKQFWWYTCIGPKWEGTDYFIDEGAASPRMHPWTNYLYGVTGILYWQTTSWGRVDDNPWLKTETYPAGNGDGSLLYPGSHVNYNGPVASIRLKNLREGMEDYELLHLLGDTLKITASRIGGRAMKYNPDNRLFEHAYALVKPEGRANPLGRNTPYLMFVTTDYRELEAQREKVFDEIGQALVSPLLLVETEPDDNGYTTGKSAIVKGFVESGAELTVNGKAVGIIENSFNTEVPVTKGKNVINIVATINGSAKKAERIVFVK